MIGLQANINDVQKIVSTNNTTPEGILLGFALVAIFAIGYLFKYIQQERVARDELHMNYSSKIEALNEAIIKINIQYAESIRSLVEFNKK